MSVHVTQPPSARRPRRLRTTVGAAALAALSVLTAAVVPAASATTIGGDAVVQAELDKLVEEGDFPSAMASLRDARGRTTFQSAGLGDVDTGAPVPREGQVRIASATKMFTATVVLQLVGEGRIGLDEPVETYLPNVVRGEGIDGHDITVRQLLQHTSGLPEYTDLDFKTIQHTYAEPRDLVDRAFRKPADFAPGTNWRYSNTNYVLAGLVVQRVTGRPVGEEITNRVIEPTGLKHTYWPSIGEQTIREKHPEGYYTPQDPGEERTVFTEMDPSWGWAAGQLIGTPGDVNKFLGALLGGELLEKAQLDEMKSAIAASGFPPNWRYGLGLVRIELSCGEIAWGHGGDIDGFETRDAITEDGEAATVVVTALPRVEQAASMPTDAALDAVLCR